jgi:predicted ATP-binding protein involved in virulence
VIDMSDKLGPRPQIVAVVTADTGPGDADVLDAVRAALAKSLDAMGWPADEQSD